jgi:hypothetical protein
MVFCCRVSVRRNRMGSAVADSRLAGWAPRHSGDGCERCALGTHGGLGVFPQHAVINARRGKRFIGVATPTWVLHRAKEGTVDVVAVPGHVQVEVNCF